jgi:hypothetical protein
MTSAASQTAGFLARYSPQVARQFRAARSHLRKCFPRGYELVYDTYNALGCGYSFRDRGSGVVISLVAYPRWVTLFFFHGIDLPDPDRLLQGSGARIRSLRLEPFSRLRSSSVRKLIAGAARMHSRDFAGAPPLATVVKARSVKQRPRRPPVGGRTRQR